MMTLGNSILRRLVNLAEIHKERSRDITLSASHIPGYPLKNAEDSNAFHANLKLAAEDGGIQLEWKRHYENHELKRIRLVDGRKLSAFLGIGFRPDDVDALCNTLNLNELPEWVAIYIDELRKGWCQDKTVYGLKWENADNLTHVLTAIRALHSQPLTHTLDYRQFGARYLGNSKLTRQIEKPLTAIYREYQQLLGHTDRDIMQAMNIVPMSHPVLMRGPLTVGNASGMISANVFPYIGIHDSCLENIELIKKPEYVLTIENLSSFNEYTQKIQDDGIVLYTGGFPTSIFQLFYKQLIEMAESQTYHWGDTDPHGFLILRTLQNIAGNAIVLPHLLDHPSGSAYSSSDKSALERIMPVNTIVDNLLLKLIERGTGYIEQEEVEAISPVCRHLTNNIQSSRQENS